MSKKKKKQKKELRKIVERISNLNRNVESAKFDLKMLEKDIEEKNTALFKEKTECENVNSKEPKKDERTELDKKVFGKIKTDADIIEFCKLLMDEFGIHSSYEKLDDFIIESFLCVIVAFLVNHSDEMEQSFRNVMRLVRAGNVEDDGYGCYSTGSVLDTLMRHIPEDSFANTQYLSFRLASTSRQQLTVAWVATALKVFDLYDYEENEKVQSFARKWLGESPCEEEQTEEFEFVPVPMENKD